MTRVHVPDFERSSYLGFPMVVAADRITVFTPAGRTMGRVASVKQARLLVRGYRRAEKETADA